MENKLTFNPAIVEQLQDYVLPGKALWCKPSFEYYYEAAYEFWQEITLEGLHSEGLDERAAALNSDDFIHQDEIHCLFNGNEPVGLFAFRWMDLRFEATREQSYFKSYYPESVIAKLVEQRHFFLMTMGQLMVHPQWRRSKIGPCISEILVGFAVTRLLASPASALIAFSRNNRKTQDLCVNYGGSPLVESHRAYGLDSTIMIIYPDRVTDNPMPGISEATARLWQEKRSGTLWQPYYQKESSYEKAR